MFSSKLYKSNHISLTTYKSKPTKKVLVLSSTLCINHQKSTKVTNVRNIRNDQITIFDVDVADHMARKYNVKSKSCRWPLQVFLYLLEINAWVLYKETINENISRQEFLFQLVAELKNEEENNVKLSTSSNSYIRKTCKTRKICSRCEKDMCGNQRIK